MILLIIFAFLAGVVTILSPCILPVLPIILSSSLDVGGKKRPVGVVLGFILSFTFFTLFLSTIVKISGVPADSLRLFSVIVIAGFGISLLLTSFQVFLEKLFSRILSFMPLSGKRTGFSGGLLIGFSLGLLWTPCVGPILASVISLAITGSVTFDAFLITMAFSIGTSIPMLLIMLSGQNVLKRHPWFLYNSEKIQKAFGILMILTAMAILLNLDRNLQTYILNKFPQYGISLIRLEESELVEKELKNLKMPEKVETGRPMF